MVVFTDGFDSYSATADLVTKWTSNTNATNITFSAAGGRFGGGAVSLTTSGYLQSGQIRTTGNSTFCLAFWLKMSAKPSSSQPILILQDSNNEFSTSILNGNVAFACSSVSGNLGYKLYRDNGTAFTFGTINVCDNAWHWIEIHSKAANSGGILRIIVDGVQEVNLSGDLIYSTYADPSMDRISLTSPPGCVMTIDDLVIWDDVAGSLAGDLVAANFPIGQSRIETLRPTGAGSLTQFSPSAGSNYACVDETSPNGDTDYVSTAALNTKDLYAFSNLSSTPTSILAVVVNAYAKNNGTGSISLVGAAHSGSSDAESSSVAVGAAYRTLRFNIPQDPDTSSAWTGAGVDAAEFGIKTT